MATASVAQERATEEVAAAVVTQVCEHFGGSAETAFIYLLEVTPRALNQSENSQAAQEIINSDDSHQSENEIQLDESIWARQQQQEEQKDRCATHSMHC
jgi:hypothetical protein